MRILHVSAECSSVISAGGVGDVVLQLANQCVASGLDTTVLLPRFGRLDSTFEKEFGDAIENNVAKSARYQVPMRFPLKDIPGDVEEVRFGVIEFPVTTGALHLCLVHAARFARRDRPYGWPQAYPDAYAINLLLQKAALLYMQDRCFDSNTVVHGHDAHAGCLSLLARKSRLSQPAFAAATFVTTVHNCGWAYRQRLWMHDYSREMEFLEQSLEVDRDTIARCIITEKQIPGFEPFAAAALFGDHLTIVSEGYCWEILQASRSETSEADADLVEFSRFLQERQLATELRSSIRGITNGIDAELVGPEALPNEVRPAGVLADHFDWKRQFRLGFLSRLAEQCERPSYWSENKETVGRLTSMDPDTTVLFTFIARLDRQKGFDLLCRAVEEVFPYRKDARLCINSGDELPEVYDLARRFDGRVVFLAGRSERIAKEIYAAGDFFLMPSRFEPGSMADYRAQLNGNIPIVNQVGGLSKVINGRTGIGFFGLGDRTVLRGLVDAMHRAADLFEDKERLAAIRLEANAKTRKNHRWDQVIPSFLQLYGASPSGMQA